MGYWKSIYDTAVYKEYFESPKIEQRKVPFSLSRYAKRSLWCSDRQDLLGTTEIVVERIKSKSYITAIDSEEDVEDLIADIMEVMKKGEGRVWTDESNDEFKYPYLWVRSNL